MVIGCIKYVIKKSKGLGKICFFDFLFFFGVNRKCLSIFFYYIYKIDNWINKIKMFW